MTEQTTLVRYVGTREAAHEAIVAGYEQAKTLLALDKRVKITVEEAEDEQTVKQRKFFHGPLLKQVSEQVRVEGERYIPKAWKILFKQLFLPDRWEMRHALVWDAKTRTMRRGKRKTPHRIVISTNDLSIKQYSLFIDQCIAHATTEWGVEFHFLVDEREAVRYVAQPRKARPRATNPEEQPA